MNPFNSKFLLNFLVCILFSGFIEDLFATPAPEAISKLDFSGGAFIFPDIRSNPAYGFFLGMGVSGYLQDVPLGIRLDGAFINSYSNKKYGSPWLGASDDGVVYDFHFFDVDFTIGIAYGFYIIGLQESASLGNQLNPKNMDFGINFGDYYKSFLQFRNSYLSHWGIKISHSYFFPNSKKDEGVRLDQVGQGIGVGFYYGWP